MLLAYPKQCCTLYDNVIAVRYYLLAYTAGVACFKSTRVILVAATCSTKPGACRQINYTCLNLSQVPKPLNMMRDSPMGKKQVTLKCHGGG